MSDLEVFVKQAMPEGVVGILAGVTGLEIKKDKDGTPYSKDSKPSKDLWNIVIPEDLRAQSLQTVDGRPIKKVVFQVVGNDGVAHFCLGFEAGRSHPVRENTETSGPESCEPELVFSVKITTDYLKNLRPRWDHQTIEKFKNERCAFAVEAVNDFLSQVVDALLVDFEKEQLALNEQTEPEE